MALTIQNKKYDEVFPFRLIVIITKADKKGELLQRLIRGLTVGHSTLESAFAAQEKYLGMTMDILASNLGSSPHDFASYGVSLILDERIGKIFNTMHIGTTFDE